MNLDIENKKELIRFNKEEKIELETLKMDFFKEKQNIMKNNTPFLWSLKNNFQDKSHKQQLEKIKLLFELINCNSKVANVYFLRYYFYNIELVIFIVKIVLK